MLARPIDCFVSASAESIQAHIHRCYPNRNGRKDHEQKPD